MIILAYVLQEMGCLLVMFAHGICGFSVRHSSFLCVKCGNWSHCRHSGVNKVTPMFSRNLACRKYEKIIGEVEKREEKLCNEVES